LIVNEYSGSPFEKWKGFFFTILLDASLVQPQYFGNFTALISLG